MDAVSFLFDIEIIQVVEAVPVQEIYLNLISYVQWETMKLLIHWQTVQECIQMYGMYTNLNRRTSVQEMNISMSTIHTVRNSEKVY